jgi:hypothetical protein
MESHPIISRRTFGAVAAVAALALTTAGAETAIASQRPDPTAPLANLSHLNFLLDTVPLTPVDGHTTYKIRERPIAQAPWTYADGHPDGSYARVGGGSLDPATGRWSQGAYNADDIARTAVVYLRHWQQTGDADSRNKSFDLLRELTYLQTATGPNAGNVVLWQQADGALNPSAEPVELPDPSDSAESYWLARTIWALGEGYAAFKSQDAAFAGFLRDRLHLALASLNKQSLGKYGSFDTADGVRVPSWLIADGADASAEAVLGLTAYAKAAPGDAVVSRALVQLTEGIAAMSSGTTGQWPFGAILPWTKSQTLWHAWGGMAAAAVSGAAPLLRRPDLLRAAVLDAAQFTPQLLVSGGPDNAWSPTPGEAQIAYGVDSRLHGLVATAQTANAPGLLDVAAVAAGWYFGANKSGRPAYNPATGTAVDGIEADGRVNPNSGAESTIHALLSMLLLDANPALKAQTLGINRTVEYHGLSVVEAETGAITGGAVVTPASAWTGEANISGGSYVALQPCGSLSIAVPAATEPRNVYPIVNRGTAPAGSTTWTAGRTTLGSTRNGGAGPQGITDAPGILFPLSLQRELPGAAAIVTGRTNGPAMIDALLLQPQLSSVTVDGPAGKMTLFVSAASGVVERTVDVPKGFKLKQRAFDASGRTVTRAPKQNCNDNSGRVSVAPGGFTAVSLVRK